MSSRSGLPRMWFSARAVSVKGKLRLRAASTAAATRSTAWSSAYSSPRRVVVLDRAADRARPGGPDDRGGGVLGRGPVPVLEVDRHRQAGRLVERARVIDDLVERDVPSMRPSVKAKPELVVASALKPSASRTRAEPASQGFGITNGSPSWRARKSAAFWSWEETWPATLTKALALGRIRLRRVARSPRPPRAPRAAGSGRSAPTARAVRRGAARARRPAPPRCRPGRASPRAAPGGRASRAARRASAPRSRRAGAGSR